MVPTPFFPGLEVGAGAVGYLGTVFLFHRQRIATILALVRGGKEAPAAASDADGAPAVATTEP